MKDEIETSDGYSLREGGLGRHDIILVTSRGSLFALENVIRDVRA